MNKKLIVPIVICTILLIAIVSTCIDGGNKVKLRWNSVPVSQIDNDSIDLKVYIENSGSMDAYMCSGSNLKDAVFDYISDLKRNSTSCSLYYINSKIIPYQGELKAFIKDLTPNAFARAGGDRRNTDLMQILDTILKEQKQNTVSVFVSDCILDIPQNAIDYLGNCQVSIKNTFNEAISANPRLGVEIIQLDSKFEGYWYCGQNKALLTGVKRPYYIWVIGDQRYLAKFNKNVPVNNIIGGIKNYCAYATSQPIPFDIEKKSYVVNHTGIIPVNILVNLDNSLQSNLVICNTSQFKSANPAQVSILSIKEISDISSMYSHIIEIEIDNPATLQYEDVTFSYPYLSNWISESNDTTGNNVSENISKTTGLMSLLKGVAEAFKDQTNYGTISFELKNK